MNRFVEFTVHHDAAKLLADAAVVAGFEWQGRVDDSQLRTLADLSSFLNYVYENPAAFTPTGTKIIPRGKPKFKGPATPPRKRRRTSRHQIRIDAAKERRRNRATTVAEHNLDLERPDQVEGDGLVNVPLWKRILSRGGASGAEG